MCKKINEFINKGTEKDPDLHNNIIRKLYKFPLVEGIKTSKLLRNGCVLNWGEL